MKNMHNGSLRNILVKGCRHEKCYDTREGLSRGQEYREKMVQLKGSIPLKQKREKLRRRDFLNMIVRAKTHSSVWEVKPYLGQTSLCIAQY